MVSSCGWFSLFFLKINKSSEELSLSFFRLEVLKPVTLAIVRCQFWCSKMLMVASSLACFVYLYLGKSNENGDNWPHLVFSPSNHPQITGISFLKPSSVFLVYTPPPSFKKYLWNVYYQMRALKSILLPETSIQ